MSGVSTQASPSPHRPVRRYTLIGTVVLALLITMALDTKVVKTDPAEGAQAQGFSAERYGEQIFPEIKTSVESRAVDARELAEALQANQQAAAEKYGVGTTMPVIPVRFQGIVGEGKSGIYNVQVEGLPEGMKIRLQTGPVLTSTELRDATGTIKFGDFTNQIEYQNAGAAINRALKTALLDKLDRETLPGKEVSVVGVFRLLTPNNWLVTPVTLEVK